MTREDHREIQEWHRLIMSSRPRQSPGCRTRTFTSSGGADLSDEDYRLITGRSRQANLSADSPHVPAVKPSSAVKPSHIRGLAIRYNVLHERWPGGPMIIHPAAFEDSIQSGNVDVRLDHGSESLAFAVDGSLRVTNTVVGLFVDVHVANHYTRDLIAGWAATGQVRGWSVGYFTANEVVRDGVLMRARLDEISLCVRAQPASDGTYAQWLPLAMRERQPSGDAQTDF